MKHSWLPRGGRKGNFKFCRNYNVTFGGCCRSWGDVRLSSGVLDTTRKLEAV